MLTPRPPPRCCRRRGRCRPPGTPAATSRSGRRMIMGATLLSGRFRGATKLARPGRGSKRLMPCPKMMPVPGTVTHEPNALPWVTVTAATFPSASAAEICNVPSRESPSDGVVFAQQADDGHVHEVGIARIPQPVAPGAFERLRPPALPPPHRGKRAPPVLRS